MKTIQILIFSWISISAAQAQKATETSSRHMIDTSTLGNLNLFMEGLRLKSLGDEKTALVFFDMLLSKDSENAGANFEASQLDAIVGNYDQALIKAKKAYNADKNNKFYQEHLITQLTKSGKIGEAIETIESVLKLNPKKDILKLQYAYLLNLNDNPKKAIKVLSELENPNEANETIIYEKIKIYLSQKDYENAELEFKKLIKANPNDTRFLGNLADFYLKNKEIDKADIVFNDILRIEPVNVSALLFKVQYFQLKKDELGYQKTIKDLMVNKELNLDTKISLIADKFSQGSRMDSNGKQFIMVIAQNLVELHPAESRAYQVLGDISYISQDYKKAAIAYRKSLSLENSEYNVWQNLFYAFTALQNYQELADSSSSALDLFPANAIVYLYNGIANNQIGKYELAEKSLKRGLKFVGENIPLQTQINSSLGEVYQKIKKFSESDKHFETAVKLDQNNAYTLNNFAYYLSLRKDRLEYAKTMSKKSLEIEGENSSFLDTYAWINFQLGNLEEAKYYQEKALKSEKEDMSTIFEHYGDILIKLNDVENALKYWNKAKEAGSKNKALPIKISKKEYVEYQE
jgi:tetratricopeptide (TPR) repeat protein